jgi:hypothetical protein
LTTQSTQFIIAGYLLMIVFRWAFHRAKRR